MSSMHQQHLNPDNMTMIEASLARVRSLYNLKRGSKDELHIAAVMIGEFQIGNNTEDGLYNVFLGSTQLRRVISLPAFTNSPVLRKPTHP